MAEDYAKSLIGKEIEFFKTTRNLLLINEFGQVIGTRGKRVYLRLKGGTLPAFENLDYQKLKRWSVKCKK